MHDASTDITAIVGESRELPTRWEPDERGWVPHGPCFTLRPDGRRHVEITFMQGVAHGPYRDYWSNGSVSLEGQYVNGLQDGEWRFYNSDASLREVIRFVAGREVVDWDRFFDPPREEEKTAEERARLKEQLKKPNHS